MKAAIIGYGKSGVAAEKLLRMKGASIIDIFDGNKALGFRPIEDFKDVYDLTVVSPGINRAKYNNLPSAVTSEIELACEFMSDNAKIIAVTGTNGKSTTTHLTAQILRKAGVDAVACGNIGLPFAEAVLNKDIEVFVIELSSFQIELLNNFNVKSACIINITPDHLDRYGNMDNYYKAKLDLLRFIDNEGIFICNQDDRVLENAAKYNFSTVSVDDSFEKYPVIKDSILDFGEFYVDLSKYSLFGNHNIVNLTFALLLAAPFIKLKGNITEYIDGVVGMPHRTELVGVYNGVSWINDSKGTNVDSVLTALKSVKKPSWLLLGGRDKKSDFRVLKDLINTNVSTVCFFGEAASVISKQLSNLINVKQESFSSLKEAVKFCSKEAEKGSTVLLSPGCTSFDEFKSYEDRGEKFTRYVREYTGGNNDKL